MNLKILYIEDDRVDQMALQRFVDKSGFDYDIIFASTIEETRELILTKKFDIVITDYLLSSGTGLDVIELARPLPVIFVTGEGDQELAVRALTTGAYDYLVKDPDRNYLKMLPLKVDNTIRRWRAERQHRLYSLALMSTSDCVFITDERGRIVMVNQAFSSTYGYSTDEAVGMPIIALWADRSQAPPSPTGPGKAEEALHARKNGEIFPVSLSHSILQDEDSLPASVVFLARDITRQKATQKELESLVEKLKQTQRQLIHAEKLSSLGQLAAGIAHEINNPLTSVLGFAELMERRTEDESQKKFLQKIITNAERIMKILLELRDFYLPSQHKMDNTHPEKIIKNAIPLVRVHPKADNITVSTKTSSDLPAVYWDENQILQVMVNLLLNACQAMPDGGEVIIEAYSDRPAQEIVFVVTDTGVGIPPEEIDRIFDPFFTTKPDWKGTGLGLSVCHTIIDKHNGSISVESRVGHGSKFTVRLPLSPENSTTKKKRPST